MNPMATLRDLAQDPNVEVNTIIGFEELPKYTVETGKCFIGLSVSVYIILGFDFKIGLNL